MVGSAGGGHRGFCRGHHSVTNGVTAASRIVALKERAKGETRVSAPPQAVRKFIAFDARVSVETGAGVLACAAILPGVQGPYAAPPARAKRSARVVAVHDPFGQRAGIDAYAAGQEAFAMEFRPRIARVRSTGIRSSQTNIAGEKTVPVASGPFGCALPIMMMVAAGRISAPFEMGAAA